MGRIVSDDNAPGDSTVDGIASNSSASDESATGELGGPESPAANESSPRNPWLRRAAFGVVAVLILSAGWLAFTGYKAYQSAATLASALHAAEGSARESNVADAAAAMSEAQKSAHELGTLTSGPLWWLVAHTPVVGSQVSAARTLAVAADNVLTAAAPLTAALTSLTEGQLRTSEGSINLPIITTLGPAMHDVAIAAGEAQTSLAAIDPAGLPSSLAAPIVTAQTQLPEIAHRLADMSDGISLLPQMLGSTEPRSWAVMLQNPSEVRGTGGLFGGFARVTFDKGGIKFDEVGSNDALFPSQPVDPTVVAQDVQDSWGMLLTEWNSFNLSPHFPDTGLLVRQGMKQRKTPVQGVVAIDPALVAALLAGTGPVQVRGITVDSSSAVDFITKDVYRRFTDPAVKDAVLVEFVQATFGALLSKPLDQKALLVALWRAEHEGHLLAWSSVSDEQAWIGGTNMGGVLPEDAGPHVAIALNNGTGSKVDSYLATEATYSPGTCTNTLQQDSHLAITLANNSPAGLPDYVVYRADDSSLQHGGSVTLVGVYGPKDSFLIDATIDGQPAPVTIGSERGRPLWNFTLTMDRGKTSKLVLHFSEPSAVAGDPKSAPALTIPPLLVPPVLTITPAPCPTP